MFDSLSHSSQPVAPFHRRSKETRHLLKYVTQLWTNQVEEIFWIWLYYHAMCFSQVSDKFIQYILLALHWSGMREIKHFFIISALCSACTDNYLHYRSVFPLSECCGKKTKNHQDPTTEKSINQLWILKFFLVNDYGGHSMLLRCCYVSLLFS